MSAGRAEGLKNKQIVTLDMGSLIAGADIAIAVSSKIV